MTTAYMMTKEALTEEADVVKVAVLRRLVIDKLISLEDAEKWAENHTILYKKKNVFRTLSDKWRNIKTESGEYYYIVVSKG